MMIKTVSTLFVPLILLTQFTIAQAAQLCSDQLRETTPLVRFIINDNQTVTDRQTGLIWKRCAEGRSGNDCAGTDTPLNWQQALAAAQQATFAGETDWRLPNIKELSSIVERSCRDPAINLAVFPNTTPSEFWSGSPSFQFRDPWTVSFNFGETGIRGSIGSNRTNTLSVRLVRDAPTQ